MIQMISCSINFQKNLAKDIAQELASEVLVLKKNVNKRIIKVPAQSTVRQVKIELRQTSHNFQKTESSDSMLVCFG